MRTHLEFRSSSFPAYPSEDEEINPGCFGKRLAEFLSSALLASGFAVQDICAEDWGWRIDVHNDAFPLWLGCGNYDEYPDGFLCFIEPSRPYVRQWFRRVPTAETVERVGRVLEAALASHDGVKDLRWWSEDEARRR